MTIKTDPLDCPVCTCPLERVPVLGYNLHKCRACGELVQELGPKPGGGTMLAPIGQLLHRHELGDDRVRAAMSETHVSSIKSFLDIYENLTRMVDLEMAAAKGGLRSVLAQIENRVDHALSRLTGLDFASDQVAEALEALRVVRDLVSTLPSRNRGIPQRSDDAGASE
jgi:hypothetical protein